MQLKTIKDLLPKDWNLEVSVTLNGKYCTIKITEDDLNLNDQDFKDRILIPVIETFKRTLQRT